MNIFISSFCIIPNIHLSFITNSHNGWLAAGKLKYRETIAQGVGSAPGAFIGLLAGANTGKQLVKLI